MVTLLLVLEERVSEGGVQYATYADGAWTYEVFSPEPAEDTTVYAEWPVKDEKICFSNIARIYSIFSMKMTKW